MIEFKANKSVVFTYDREDKVIVEIVLRKGQLYNWKTKTPDGQPDTLRLGVLRNLLANGVVQLVDTRPIDEACLR